ncbi:MAG: UDP-N-acetylmuramoyl-tripeptide--D-alanyl-D-alanine ligase [Firmicutes bacterium]|nr:UDP-N-acetylmuramoyl-tripeptide--D-alanyl-D-alanine ligase [Bacillota bacterium]
MVFDLFILLMFFGATILYFMEALTEFQQNGYRFSLPDSVDKKKLSEWFVLFFLSVGATFFYFLKPIAGQIIAVLILTSAISVFWQDYKLKRTKYKFTKRGIRLFIAQLLFFATVLALIFVFIGVKNLGLMALFAVLLLARDLFLLPALIIFPCENLNKKRYILRAKKTLSKSNLIKIGITGSFGKTSCKNILATMLRKKYTVAVTQENYNTPMGICLAVKKLNGSEEVFIAEMGARRRGDIKELCGIVKPEYAIVTGVGNEHLKSFKSRDNIYLGKKELPDSLPRHGFAVLNGDNAGTTKMFNAMKNSQISATAVLASTKDICFGENNESEESGTVFARNIKMSKDGCSFEVIGAGQPFTVLTKLLGRHNVINILLCIALAVKLEVSEEQIIEAVSELKPVPHRLELIENARGMIIIDDSYNCNLEGALSAYEVLTLFEGRKVLFTQGMVELGLNQHEMNFKLGAEASNVADIVILAGVNSRAIEEGLLSADFKGEIFKFKDLFEAKDNFASLLNAGDILLIQNDLP